MKGLNKILNGEEFESSSGKTEQWLTAFSNSKREIKKAIAHLVDNLEFSREHFYFSGFFTRRSDNQIFYFSVSDVRGHNDQLLIRTATSYKDYTGGGNNYVTIDDDFPSRIQSFLS